MQLFTVLTEFVKTYEQKGKGIEMKYEQAMEYLEEMNQRGSVMGLESSRELCRRLGNPQENLQFVHIAGTNGKGSILAYVSTVLAVSGYRVGRYLSPVIRDYRERIQVNGRMITKKAVGELLETVKAAAEAMAAEGLPKPTVFEMETAMAFLYFKQRECEIVVLETGLGGALDSTNIIQNTLVAVLASISMDHMAVLGKTLSAIATQKAGIIKKGCRVVTGSQAPEVMEVLCRAAEEKASDLVVADASAASRIRYGILKQQFDYAGYKNLEITLAGKYQIDNCITAIEVIKALEKKGFLVTEKALRTGLRETRWEGRFTVIQKQPLFIIDGAHNEDAAKKLADSVRFYFTNRRIIYIMGVLRDKEYEKILAETYSLAEQIITLTPPDNPRALSAYELAVAAKEYHPNVTAVDSVEEAVEVAELLADKEGVIVAFGSLSYLGRLLEIKEKKKGVKHGR